MLSVTSCCSFSALHGQLLIHHVVGDLLNPVLHCNKLKHTGNSWEDNAHQNNMNNFTLMEKMFI